MSINLEENDHIVFSTDLVLKICIHPIGGQVINDNKLKRGHLLLMQNPIWKIRIAHEMSSQGN